MCIVVNVFVHNYPLGNAYLCGTVSSGPAPPDCGKSPGAYIKVGNEQILKWIKDNAAGASSENRQGRDSITLDSLEGKSYFLLDILTMNYMYSSVLKPHCLKLLLKPFYKISLDIKTFKYDFSKVVF